MIREDNALKRKTTKGPAMYGISRIDDDRHRAHAWRVSLSRRGKRYVRNFPDKRHGGKRRALQAAQQYRDEFIAAHPPLTRREFCSILRNNNRTGITGVYRYAKSFALKDGETRRSWYWEATWPIGKSQQAHVAFPVNTYGEERARRLAIQARGQALAQLRGYYWSSARGAESVASS